MKIRTAAVATGVVVALSGGVAGVTAATVGPSTSAAKAAGKCAQPGPYELPQGGEPVDLDPKDFTTKIDHPYWPMKVGTTWRYVERGGGEKATVRVTVTDRTKMIEGIKARVVHDAVRVDGELAENTWDWFAQDSGGSLWYLGEFTQEYENGEVVSTEGSWKHGTGGAQAGMILPANLKAGCGHREEFLEGEAEDQARILSTRETIKTPTGLHHRVVQTANTTPLTPNLLENKFYAKGMGPVLEFDISPQIAHAKLVKITHK